MLTVLSVAEKPSVAKELARIISRDNYNRRNGHSQYNHIFEINQCEFGQNRSRCKMNVTSVTGHMMELEFPPEYKQWSSVPAIELFDLPTKKSVKEEGKNIAKTLVDEARKSNILLLWLDCDLEGENICYEVIEICTKANPRLDVYRARFSALIDRDIFRTLMMPERPNPNMNDAVDARQEIDLRIGAAFTRFQTLRLQNKFNGISSKAISYGPCQFPTLGFVVERYLEIEAFVPADFWYISCEYVGSDPDTADGTLVCPFTWDRVRVYDRFTCTVFFDTCCLNGGLSTVTFCDSKPTTRQRPCPLNTIELQKRATRFLKMSSDRTMAVAEALYQRGILSYPRTETDFFKEGFELLPLLNDHRGNSTWGPFVTDLLENRRFTWPRPGSHDDQAHPPIHPTKSIELSELQDREEKMIYELVTIHFLACCATDALGFQSTVQIEVPEQGESFTSTGLMVTDRAWLAVYYKYEKWIAKKIPVFKVGDTFHVKRLLMHQGRTEPPGPLSESELITQMDRNGIGTDATLATHITTIQQRDYATKDASNRFTPTPLGLALVEGYKSMGLALDKHYLRAAMERDCQKIARGELRKEVVIHECLAEMKKVFVKANEMAGKLDQAVAKYFSEAGGDDISGFQVAQINFSRCGICQSLMSLLTSSDGSGGGGRRGRAGDEPAVSRILRCDNCKRPHRLPGKGVVTPHEATCPICNFQVISITNPETHKSHPVCPYCFRYCMLVY